jgi:hypothetical protein
MRQAVHQFYDSVTNTICSSPENDTIDSVTVNLLTIYADDTQQFMAAWEKLDRHLGRHQMMSNSQPYQMGDVCKIAKAGIGGRH